MKKFIVFLQSGYDFIVKGMTWLAAAVVVATCIAIMLDVSMRSLGFRSPSWTSAFSEYAMLIAAMGAAPLIIRERGHVWVEIIETIASENIQRVLAVFVVILCFFVSAVMAWYSAVLAFDSAARNEVDIRSVIMPRWFLYAVLATGFTLCACEFLRLFVRRESMFEKSSEERVQL
ncbi:TRAP transporter small permease [Brucella pituitosa]|uniref:TRAP transporter small permease protein n=1 Tax=Brucella pituitosa TaxID=571256 RepID=A0ABS3K5X1_9HYPH|nr:TRAP transporter small permease [Brucella pituitosa]MBO1042301.1 TRAP transporter small permease [Brucella pituitosa]